MKVANKHKIYLVDANVTISKSQSRQREQIQGVSSKKEYIWICGMLTELNCRLWVRGKGWNRFNDKNVYKGYIDKEWI